VPTLVRHLRLFRLLASCLCIALVCSGQVRADGRVERSAGLVLPTKSSALDLVNPVALLSQAIASIIGVEADYVVLGDGSLRAAALAAQTSGMNLEFAAGREQAKVSLLLAESQIRVRLAPDLLLRCEVSSRDEANVDPELKFDLGLQFKFK
jgi:hypothetical protein